MLNATFSVIFTHCGRDLLVCLLLSLAVDVPVDEASRSNAAAPGTLDEALNNGR